jgi:hypothetical protein
MINVIAISALNNLIISKKGYGSKRTWDSMQHYT